MAIADLKSVLKIFGGGEVGEDEQNELFKEVLVMTLARAADADINIQTVEVDRIRKDMEQIIEQAGATLVGAAVIINKSERRDIEAILTMDDLSD